jgi:hypothetical protein
MASTKVFPIIFITDSAKRLMKIAIPNGSQLTDIQDITYSEGNGIITFTYQNKVFKYFCADNDLLIRLSGDDTLAAINYRYRAEH